MNTKGIRRKKIHYRIRKNVSGTAQKPRLSVFRSNTAVYLQLIDDASGKTITGTSTKDKDIEAQTGTKSEKAKLAGSAIARKAIDLGVNKVVFDRSGYLYHGRVKAAADGAREGGLQF